MTNVGRSGLVIHLSLMLALTAALSVCLVPGPPAHAQTSLLPLQFSDVVVFGTNSVRLDTNATIVAGHVVANTASAGPTLLPGFELSVDKSALTPAGYAIAADSISVAAQAVVNGNAYYNNLTNTGTINGSLNSPLPSLPIFAPLPAFETASPGTTDVTVPQSGTQTLAPGSYRDITLAANSTLTLSPGVYNARSITMAKGAALLFQNLSSGKADVRVQNQIVTLGDVTVGPSDGDPLKAAKIIFYVGFTSGPTLLPEAVAFGKGSTIKANVYAPNGTLLINELSTATGAFLARDVEIGKGAQVDLETFFTQQAPTITSANSTTFTVGQAGSFTVTTTGFPTPSITRGGAALPSGVSFVDNGDGTGTLSGTPGAGTGGTYAITFTASNGVPPDAVQNFTLTVNQAPAITSANTTTFTVGTAGSFTVTTSGFPAPTITRGGAALPAGINFIDNGNGTGTLSGTPAAGTGGSYAITFTATNAAGTSPTQNFTLVVNQTPVITSADSTTFIVGQAGSFTVTTTGFPTPSITRGGAALPSGVNFIDNGNGTGTLSGTPAAGTGGNYAITFTATNAAGSSPTQNFTLTVAQAPAITSANATTFTVGQAGSFTVTTTGFPPASIAQGGATLPSGVTFVSNGDGTGTLSGTPAAGTGGVYAITFTATNTAGTSPTQNFTLTVNQAPAITSANTTTFTVGQPGSFTVTTTGFPTPAIAQGGALPGGVNFVDNGNGTGTLSGTPVAGSGGTYPITFTASNGVPPNAVQNFTLVVQAPPSAVNDGPYLTDANTTFSRATSDPDDLLDNDSLGAPAATITSFGGGSLGGTVTSNAAGDTATFGTGGSLTVQSSGAFTFTPSTGFTGVFTFQYRLTNTAGTSDATVTIHVRPRATSDVFGEAVVGNVIVDTATGVTFSVLANDVFNGPVTATLLSGNSTQGGAVTLNPTTGTFSYNPPVGYQGVDTFSYTITDTSGFTSAPATVTVTVSGIIWFVNNTSTCSSNCNGRLTNPFTTLDAFTSVNDGVGLHPANNHNIFVYESATAYTFVGGTLLRSGQKLIGQDATATLATIAGVTAPSGSTLPPMNTGGNATTIGSTVPLAASSTVRGLTISTGSSTGLSGGAVSGVSVSETIVTTTIGTAVDLNGTGGTMSLIRASASGGSNGIVLQNTTGSFTVVGDGTDTALGGNGSGGTLSGMTGANGAVAGNAVYLNNAQNVTLRRMLINGTNQNHGIRGIAVSNFTLEYSTVTGTNGTTAGLSEGSVVFDNLTGTSSIVASVMEGGLEDNLNVVNAAGTLNLSVTGSTFGFNSTANGNNNILLETQNVGTVMNVTLQSSLIKGARADFLNLAGNSGSTMNVTLGGSTPALGNTFDNLGANAHPAPVANGNRVLLNASGPSTFDINNNTVKGSRGVAIAVRTTASGTLTGTGNGHVRNNTIGVQAVANSGSVSSGISVTGDGGSDMVVAVTGNKVYQYNNHGILFTFGDEINPSSSFAVTVTGNEVKTPGNLATDFNGIHLNHGTVLATDDFTSCVDVGGATPALKNDVAGGGTGTIFPNNADIRLRQRQNTTIQLPGYIGPARDNVDNEVAEVGAYLALRNTLTTSAANSVATGGGYVDSPGSAACTVPTAP